MVRSRLTLEEHGCGEELIEAPIVDPWVTILNQVHLDVSRRQRRRRHLTWHATVGRRPAGAGPSAAARVPNAARVPRSRVVEWCIAVSACCECQ
eukprot:scaffold90304_cov56-Phaeocystis_antarctica.AAC.1